MQFAFQALSTVTHDDYSVTMQGWRLMINTDPVVFDADGQCVVCRLMKGDGDGLSLGMSLDVGKGFSDDLEYMYLPAWG